MSRERTVFARILALAAALFVFASASLADQHAAATGAGLGAATLSQLPPEARRTIASIRQGGPFAHERDGVVFGNFERLLPPQQRGYYREYTVPTPGINHRGARRIVAGRGGELYYTDDHYRSFRRIRE